MDNQKKVDLLVTMLLLSLAVLTAIATVALFYWVGEIAAICIYVISLVLIHVLWVFSKIEDPTETEIVHRERYQRLTVVLSMFCSLMILAGLLWLGFSAGWMALLGMGTVYSIWQYDASLKLGKEALQASQG